jgi:hypothetical protein
VLWQSGALQVRGRHTEYACYVDAAKERDVMGREYLLIVTALSEVGVGLLLLIAPAVLQELLLGLKGASPDAMVVTRIAGAALLAIGVSCWLGRSERQGRGQIALLAGVLIYDALVAGILGYAGLALGLVGVALWPGVALHGVLAVWCAVCLVGGVRGG